MPLLVKYDKIDYVTNEDTMRIQPVIFKKSVKNNLQTRNTNFEKSANNINNIQVHKYTGVASVDLAYASMIDKNIARELRLMGLI